MDRRKCYGKPSWEAPGLRIDSWVEGGIGQCGLSPEGPADHVIRAKNYSPYMQRVSFESASESEWIRYLKIDSSDDRTWEDSFRVPSRTNRGPREYSIREGLIVVDGAGQSNDETIWIQVNTGDDVGGTHISLPEFAVQVDIR
jgi:hypothetical protein